MGAANSSSFSVAIEAVEVEWVAAQIQIQSFKE